jgi:septal ring factor EnvC (AmiA/AmiB activator)
LKAEALLLALFTMQAGVPSPSPPVSPPAEGAPSLSSTPAGEAPTIPEGEDRLRQVRERRETLSRELERLRGEERSLLGDVDRLELEVRLRGEELHEIRIGLARTQAQMDVTVRRVRDLQKSLDAARPLLSSHARALYKLGELSYLRLLLSVDRPSDFFRGYRFVTTLARRDNARLAAFRSDLTALHSQQSVLERRTQESIALRTQLEGVRRNQDAQRRRKSELLTSIVEKEMHAAYVKELEQAEGKLRALLLGMDEGVATVPIAAFRGTLPWPCPGRVRSTFGRHKHPRFDTYTIQNGIEIETTADRPARAVHEGTVVFADRFKGYGLMVVVDHGGKHHSLYAHLSDAKVQVGQKVEAGDELGTVGVSGTEDPGLYFEMRFQGRPEDPLEWLKRPDRADRSDR